MISHNARLPTRAFVLALSALLVWSGNVAGQTPIPKNDFVARKGDPAGDGAARGSDAADGESWTINYVDPAQGASSGDLVRRALQSNAELTATRLDYERARARLRQAGLRPTPTVDIEYGTGRLIGSPGERGATVGFAMPLELGGQRGRRIELAEAEFAATEGDTLFAIANLTTVWVMANVPEAQVSRLRIGSRAQVKSQAGDEGHIAGRVNFIDQVLAENPVEFFLMITLTCARAAPSHSNEVSSRFWEGRSPCLPEQADSI
jgi:hypothetical protein